MNKFILALTLTLLTPFFSSANIFENVTTIPLVTKVVKLYDCKESNVTKGSVEIRDGDDPVLACSNVIESYVSSLNYGDCGGSSASVKSAYGTYIVVLTYGKKDSVSGSCNTKKKEFSIQVSRVSTSEIEECPEDTLIRVDANSDGETDFCAELSDIQQNDTCDFNDIYPISGGGVGRENVCIAKPDGSVCAASSATQQDGSSVYMPTEDDCYSSNHDRVDESELIDLPDGADQQCTESEGLTYCPADPNVVCPNGQCETGCGQMNGVFICLTPTEPPLCTGDDCGTEPPPCTGDDCGTEPPPCTGDDCGTGGETPCTGDDCEKKEEGFCDEEGNCDTSIVARKDPSEGLKSFWKTDYPDGVGGVVDSKLIDMQSTEFYSFIESFNPTLGAGNAPPMQICFNLGALGNYGCQGFKIDPRVYPAIRIFILITAGFLCRKILFGG